jgi:hypothetical protein
MWWRAIRRATRPEALASSTKAWRKRAPASLALAVPIACCTAVNLPSRMLAPGSFLDVLEEARAEAGQRIEPVSTGSGFPCTVMAAVFIAGTSIFGGKATIVGSYCGAYIIGMIEAGLVATGMQGFWVRAVVGLVFLAAVVFHLTMEDPARLRRLRIAGRLQRRPTPQAQEPP